MAIIDGYPATSFDAKDRAWVKAVADNSAGEVLPDVTSADNGKILGVDNGSWNKVDAPSGLPSVTAADNGKILGVDNGAWSKVDAPSSGGDLFVVAFDFDINTETYTCDKTYAEIIAQVGDAPSNVLFKYGANVAVECGQNNNAIWATFLLLNPALGELYTIHITVGSDNSITSYENGFTLTPIESGGGGGGS